MALALSPSMRVPRSLLLEPGSAFHLWWRGHNRECVLSSSKEKTSYLGFLSKASQSVSERSGTHSLYLFSFCLMSNHAHLCGQIHPSAPSLSPLSRLFQTAHSLFGRWYNRLHKRSGKVAEERFHSRLVQNDHALQTAMLYSDANPVMAGIVNHPKHYPWSSYCFYAFGQKIPGWHLLSLPGWYLDLGRTPSLRRSRYRRLVDLYIREKRRQKGIHDGAEKPREYFLGSPSFVERMTERLRGALRQLRPSTERSPP